MPDAAQFPRLAEQSLADALADTPVVVVHGARQCGKTTLALRVGGRRGYEYVNLDDDAARRAARDDPAGFVARLPERVIIDEVQRAKPASAKGKYLRKISISTTMGPGIKIDINRLKVAE